MRPSRIAPGPTGRIYLVSRDRNELGWLERDGGTPVLIGGTGWGRDALDAPSGIVIDALSVLVSDRNNHRVVRYDRDLRQVSELRTIDTSYAPARFAYPGAIAVNRRGDLGILDGDRRELVVFDDRGEFLFRCGRDVRSGIRLSDPVDVSVSGTGRWVILDSGLLVEADEFGNIVYQEPLEEKAPRAVDAGEGWTVTAGSLGLLIHTADHRSHQRIETSSFYLQSSQARIDDVSKWRDGLLLVIDGSIISYAVEGFRR